uniref:Uncharacterized protein n=1 Tax=Helianthus annuus TaxID=4232 RepID=A0A251S0K9_HELAN
MSDPRRVAGLTSCDGITAGKLRIRRELWSDFLCIVCCIDRLVDRMVVRSDS